MQNCSLKWSWWILNEEFPVLLGIHLCQRELPAGGGVTPGSGHSGAFLEMSAECCPCPAAVQRQPPTKPSLYLPEPPFFVSVLPHPLPGHCRAPGAAGPHTSPGSFPPVQPNPTAFPLLGLFDRSSARRDLGVPQVLPGCPRAAAPPVNTSRAELTHSALPPGSNEAVQESSERY